MNYLDYRTASERHLETCLKLRHLVDTDYNAKELTAQQQKAKRELLANIYYLSGYSIECMLHFSIIEYLIKVDGDFRVKIAKRRHCKIEEVSIRDLHVSDNKCNVGYSTGKFVLYRANHKFQDNIYFFSYENKVGDIDAIRGLNGKPIKEKNVYSLFWNWSADVRYSYNAFEKHLTTDDIFDFLEFTEEIFIGLTNTVLPKYA